MFIAMNRFKVIKGSEAAFENFWLSRDSHLDKVPGFVEFHLLKGPEAEDTRCMRHTRCGRTVRLLKRGPNRKHSGQHHHRAGDNKPLYLGHPQFEGFETIQTATRNRGHVVAGSNGFLVGNGT